MWQYGGKAWLPFIFLAGNFKIGIKHFILDLNRTQMFSEQLLKKTGALQRSCLTVSVSSGTSGKNRWDQYVIILEFKQHGLVFQSFLYLSVAVSLIWYFFFLGMWGTTDQKAVFPRRGEKGKWGIASTCEFIEWFVWRGLCLIRFASCFIDLPPPTPSSTMM